MGHLKRLLLGGATGWWALALLVWTGMSMLVEALSKATAWTVAASARQLKWGAKRFFRAAYDGYLQVSHY
eukprot:594089-Pyramimonas_sp.AAC.1